jgi:hypothetical protein
MPQCQSSLCPDWRNGVQAMVVEAVPFPLTSEKWSAAPLAEFLFLFDAPTVGVASIFLKGPVDPVLNADVTNVRCLSATKISKRGTPQRKCRKTKACVCYSVQTNSEWR